MKLSILATPALALSASAAAIEARGTCTALFTGSNSEGGGGPGQAPIDNNAWRVDISGGGKKWGAALKQNGKNGLITRGVTGKDFGGKDNINIDAQWNFGGNSWYHCDVKENGNNHQGTVQKDHISTGTVSVTTDKCVVHFPC